MSEIQLDLTDSEWISVLDQEAGGLPSCCANVSALRDSLFSIVRDGRVVGPWNETSLLRGIVWAYDSHDMDSLPVMKKIKEQVLADEGFAKRYEAVVSHEDVAVKEF